MTHEELCSNANLASVAVALSLSLSRSQSLLLTSLVPFFPQKHSVKSHQIWRAWYECYNVTDGVPCLELHGRKGIHVSSLPSPLHFQLKSIFNSCVSVSG